MMRSVAVATSGARLCRAVIYIVPHEREGESKWKMEEKRERDGESYWGGLRTEREKKTLKTNSGKGKE